MPGGSRALFTNVCVVFVGETMEHGEGKKTMLICCRPNWLHSPPPTIAKVADPHHFNAAPDPAVHFNAEPSRVSLLCGAPGLHFEPLRLIERVFGSILSV
jgi:hypothetical protein